MKNPIVIKVGSGVLTSASAAPRRATPRVRLIPARFRMLAREIALLRKKGNAVIVVTSGAVAAGLGSLGFKNRPEELTARQGCAALGQPLLMKQWEAAFSKHGLHPAQLLLTHGDIDSRSRAQNAQRTIQWLLEQKTTIPVINENDSVATEELAIGDNDLLSSEVAVLVKARLLVLLTTVEGLLDAKGKVIPHIASAAEAAKHLRAERGRLSVGGMDSKLKAAERAAKSDIRVVIGSGTRPGVISAAAAGKKIGTRVGG